MIAAIGAALDKIERQAVKIQDAMEKQETPGPQENGGRQRITTGTPALPCSERRI